MKQNKSIVLMGIAIIGLSCCKRESKVDLSLTVPSTYNFENVNYSGQTDRLAMLLELSTYSKSSNAAGVTLNEAKLLAMFSNGPLAGFTGSYEASKQLKNKTILTEQASLADLMKELALISKSTSAAVKDTAGRLFNKDKSKTYLLNKNGVELAQLIEKGIMGACLYYQATSVYMGASKMDVDNETIVPGEGTAMQHHWDEAFGYFSVPKDFPLNKSGLFFWGAYCNSRDALLGTNKIMMDAFLKGRAEIGAKQLTERDNAISSIRKEWDRVSATSALHYINSALSTIADDRGTFHHSMSEAIAFLYALKFNEGKLLTLAEIDSYIKTLAGTEDITILDIYATRKSDLEQVKASLSLKYSLNSIVDYL